MASEWFQTPVCIDDVQVYRAVHKPEGWGPSIACYLMTDGSAWSIVDCGWPGPRGLSTWDTLRSGLGLSWDRLERILVTHTHADHVGLAHDLSARSGKPASMHADALAEIQFKCAVDGDAVSRFLELAGLPRTESKEQAPNPFVSYSGFAPPSQVEMLEAGDVVRVGSIVLEALSTSGHAAGHLCFIDSKRRFAFMGDMVLPNMIPSVAYLPGDPVNPLGEYLASLGLLERLGCQLVFPSHGEPLVGATIVRRIDEIMNYHAERLDEMRVALLRGNGTAVMLASVLEFHGRPFKALSAAAQVVVLGEVLAYLKYLEADHVVRSSLDAEGGCLVFSLA